MRIGSAVLALSLATALVAGPSTVKAAQAPSPWRPYPEASSSEWVRVSGVGQCVGTVNLAVVAEQEDVEMIWSWATVYCESKPDTAVFQEAGGYPQYCTDWVQQGGGWWGCATGISRRRAESGWFADSYEFGVNRYGDLDGFVITALYVE